MKFIKFIKLSLFFIAIYLFFHLIIWEKYTSKIFGRDDEKYVGGIARVSYQIDALFPRKLKYTLPKQHLSKKNYKKYKIDILTIGDSFSQGVTGGTNPYYQDYISSFYSQNILNISRSYQGQLQFFEPIITLYNNGWLQKNRPKYIIIESVERFLIPRFTKTFNFSENDFHTIDDYVLSAKTHNSYIPQLKIINTANYKFIYYNFFFQKAPKVHTNVVKFNLNKDLFSTPTFQNKLLVHNEDIISLKYYNRQTVASINDNFNKLAKKLNKLDIKLIFLVGLDKYDLYSDNIVNNPFGGNNFFDLIRGLKKEYIFIDTKKIIRDLLHNGTKDIYYSDDTHWSYKASKAIAKSSQIKHLFSDKDNFK